MYQDHLTAVKDSFQQAAAQRGVQELADEMMSTFFEQHPEATAFFDGFDLKTIAVRKYCIVRDAVLDVLQCPDYSETSLSEEVFRHQVHNVKDREYYFALSDALAQTIKTTLGNNWTAEMGESWDDALAGLRHNVDLAVREHLPAVESST